MSVNLADLKERYEAGVPPTMDEVGAMIRDLEEHRAAMQVVLQECGKAMMQTAPDMLETVTWIDPAELVMKIADAAGVS